MPTATVTVRDVKNKDSGIDLSIPNHKESPGLFQTVVEYNVVCVSGLACFKSPKHKETDTVQFMIPKKNEEFEKLKKDLETKFSGTAFPPIPKSVFGITITESSVNDRRQALEHFMKFVAKTPKLATSHITLEFLGVNSITAGKFSSGQPIAQTGPPFSKSDSIGKDIFEEAREDTHSDSTTPSLFGNAEGDEQEEELFLPTKSKAPVQPISLAFQAQSNEKTARLFEDQDFGDAIKDEDEELFLVPGAKDVKSNFKVDVEDNSELLTIEDDFDNLFKPKSNNSDGALQPKQKTKPAANDAVPALKPASNKKDFDSLFEKEKKPSLFDDDPDGEDLFKPKQPESTGKPTQVSAPPKEAPSKPAKPPKPTKPTKPGKPAISAKPNLLPKPGKAAPNSVGSDKDAPIIPRKADSPPVTENEQFGADDILKYIQSNEESEASVDLFS